VFFSDGVAVGRWQLAVGNGEDLTAIGERRKPYDGYRTVWIGRCAALVVAAAVTVVVANCQLPTANCHAVARAYHAHAANAGC